MTTESGKGGDTLPNCNTGPLELFSMTGILAGSVVVVVGPSFFFLSSHGFAAAGGSTVACSFISSTAEGAPAVDDAASTDRSGEVTDVELFVTVVPLREGDEGAVWLWGTGALLEGRMDVAGAEIGVTPADEACGCTKGVPQTDFEPMPEVVARLGGAFSATGPGGALALLSFLDMMGAGPTSSFSFEFCLSRQLLDPLGPCLLSSCRSRRDLCLPVWTISQGPSSAG